MRIWPRGSRLKGPDLSGPCFAALDYSNFDLRSQSRTLFEQCDGGGVVQIVVTGLARFFIDLVDTSESGQVHSIFSSCLEHQVDVFMHELQREVGCVVAVE